MRHNDIVWAEPPERWGQTQIVAQIPEKNVPGATLAPSESAGILRGHSAGKP